MSRSSGFGGLSPRVEDAGLAVGGCGSSCGLGVSVARVPWWGYESSGSSIWLNFPLAR